MSSQNSVFRYLPLFKVDGLGTETEKMKTMKGIATAILLVFVFTISVIFVRFNSELTSIVIGDYKLLELPLSVIVLGAFVFGSLLGLLFGLRLMKVFKLKAEIRQLKKNQRPLEIGLFSLTGRICLIIDMIPFGRNIMTSKLFFIRRYSG